MVYNTGYRSGDIPCYIPGISAVIPGYIPRISAKEPKEEKASNSATLSPNREVVCVSLSPVKAQKKRKEQTPSGVYIFFLDLMLEGASDLRLKTVWRPARST